MVDPVKVGDRPNSTLLTEHEVERLFDRLMIVMGPDTVGLLLLEFTRAALKKQLSEESSRLVWEVLEELRREPRTPGSPYR